MEIERNSVEVAILERLHMCADRGQFHWESGDKKTARLLWKDGEMLASFMDNGGQLLCLNYNS